MCRYLPGHDAHVREPRVRRVLRLHAVRAARRPGSSTCSRRAERERRGRRGSQSFGPGNEVQTQEDWESRRRHRCTGTSGPTARSSTTHGEVVEFQSVGHDVTDRRRAAVLTGHQAEILEQVARGVPLDETLHDDRAHGRRSLPAARVRGHRCSTPTATTLRIGACAEPAGGLPRSARRHRRSAPTAARAAPPRTGASRCTSRDIATDAAVGRATATSRTRTTSAPSWSIADPRERRATRCSARSTCTCASRAARPTTSTGRSSPCSRTSRRSRSSARRSRSGSRTSRCTTRSPGCRTGCCSSTGSSLAIARCQRTQREVAVAVPRPRPVQERQRQPRPRRRRRAARRGRAPARVGAAARRHRRAVRRRRVHDPLRGPHDDDSRATARSRSRERLLDDRRPSRSSCGGAETFVGASVGIALRDRARSAPKSCSATPTPRCTTPRSRAAAASRCSTTRCAPARVVRARDRERRCTARSSAASSASSSSRSSSLRDARCVGAEALVRWQHPERGLDAARRVHPARRGDRARRRARARGCSRTRPRNAARWQREHDRAVRRLGEPLGPPARAARSGRARRRGASSGTGVEPANLCLEITESVLMDDAEAVIERRSSACARSACSFAIDDFGTGYSSLGYLKRFPVDCGQDRPLVRRAGSAPIPATPRSCRRSSGSRTRSACRSSPKASRPRSSSSRSSTLGCDEAQGYFFAPPQPVQDLRMLIGRNARVAAAGRAPDDRIRVRTTRSGGSE